MSAAIKRLSTIIRQHPPSSSASPQKESTKAESNNQIDAPTQPDTSMISKDNTTTSPVAEPTMTETQTAPAAEPVTSAEQPMETTTEAAAPVTAETAQEAAPTEEKPVTDSNVTPATAEASETPKKVETKQDATSVKDKSSRRTRDIGRDTIRRFSTILRSGNGHQQPKDKESAPPPVPTVPAKDETPAPTAAETNPAPAETTISSTAATPAPVEKQKPGSDSKPVKAATKTKENEKTDKAKVAPRRGSSFFSAAREVVRGPQKNKSKSITKTEVAAVAPKKSLAKGKRIVVITGASKGAGLEFVKQYAAQSDTFVIALSRTVDRSSEIRALVKDSSKSGHVRPIRVDIGNTKSVASAVKEIVEITEGRIDLLIHAAGTKADPSLRMSDIKSFELEEELRYNLVGPIALTNALLPFLKPASPPEAVEEIKPATTTDEMKKEEPMKNEGAEAKVEETKAEMAPVDASKEMSAPETKVEATPVEAMSAPATSEASATAEPSAAAVESTPMTGEETKKSTVPEVKTTDPVPASEPVPAPSDAAKPVEVEEAAMQPAEEMTPAPAPKPVYFPPTPYVVFLTPADTIANERGTIPMGSAFIATPRTLFSLSRSSLQVAIAQYGMSLGRQAGVVGIERSGALDPHANVSDADAVKGVMEYLPTVTINQSGRLLRI